ncbi:glycosyltransferase [Natronoglycomyces albus]|uniref:Glycosyltransferase n=1 Tax=Natronoglycomyces albus TaxID=2811108 RepID=A0A895XGT2_9ACTN|nr:glycosyltransferase [Natronoglycomyces albus]QSB05061.1 glycosyltransferase [Natronoglycomyces albus]
MSCPDVSVIVGVYNTEAHIAQCVQSVLDQTLHKSKRELIVVDDGSTDNTGEELKELANRHSEITVLHQPNSGGPASPRNAGLDVASGRYVFFLDADDWLAPEALERMVAMADTNRTDVVVGKYVSVDGRKVPASMFTHDQPRTDIFNSRAYWTLNPLKLFRRSLIDDAKLRFPTELPVGQDQPFTAQAYFRARSISILASYDCYHYRLRSDGGNNTERVDSARLWLRIFAHMLPLVAENVPAGPRRDLLLRRHFQTEQRDFLRHLSKVDASVQKELYAEFTQFVKQWCSPEVSTPLPAIDRLQLELARRDELTAALAVAAAEAAPEPTSLVIEGKRAFARYPGFRSSDLAVDDEYFDVSAEVKPQHDLTHFEHRQWHYQLAGTVDLPPATVNNVTSDRRQVHSKDITIVLHKRGTDEEQRFAATIDTAEGAPTISYEASCDIHKLLAQGNNVCGVWDFYIEVKLDDFRCRRRIGIPTGRPTIPKQRQPANAPAAQSRSLPTVSHYVTPFSNLSIRISETSYIGNFHRWPLRVKSLVKGMRRYIAPWVHRQRG